MTPSPHRRLWLAFAGLLLTSSGTLFAADPQSLVGNAEPSWTAERQIERSPFTPGTVVFSAPLPPPAIAPLRSIGPEANLADKIARLPFGFTISFSSKKSDLSFFETTRSGTIEWIPPASRITVFFCGGSGCGLMNSQSGPSADRQDFNLTWFAHAGTCFRLAGLWRWSTGVFFKHVSNTPTDKGEAGINALGPSLRLTRDF